MDCTDNTDILECGAAAPLFFSPLDTRNDTKFSRGAETRIETRLLPCSLAATRRGFTFYVADPLSSIREFTRSDPSLLKFVTIGVIRVFQILLQSVLSV